MTHHPNGRPFTKISGRPDRYDENLFKGLFPDTHLGRLLTGILVEFLLKQEHRMGWAYKSACDDLQLTSHPNESVAAHQWGVAALIMAISREAKFQEELPNFDRLKALEMALIHDVAELKTGDITPVDGIKPEEKHKAEKKAMIDILGCFSEEVGDSLHEIYMDYENRQCAESKFVKDCDKLDFMINAFMLERQGFTGFQEFYENSNKGFFLKIASDIADTLIAARENILKNKETLYISGSTD